MAAPLGLTVVVGHAVGRPVDLECHVVRPGTGNIRVTGERGGPGGEAGSLICLVRWPVDDACDLADGTACLLCGRLIARC